MTWVSALFLTHYMVLTISIMLAVALFSLLERKVLSLIHYRVGPDKVSLVGLLQPFADAMKLLTKDDYPVTWSNLFLFYMSPIFMFCVSLSTLMIFPFLTGSSFSMSMMVLMVFLGMTVYGTLLSGWSSNSKYALIGSVRSVSQSLSYEVVMGFLLISIVSVMSSLSLAQLSSMPSTVLGIMSPVSLMTFFLVVLAELNRTPFDLPEGESELVSGYSVEYGGVMYTFLFLGENISIFVSSFLLSFLYCINKPSVMPLGIILWASVICCVRGMLPRLRYDNLMSLCWLFLLPCSLLGFSFIIVIITTDFFLSHLY